ncbi:glycine--tRNA ligase subunit beta [Sphingomonas bacterium]|uniref:glycine--tRNA ligase subunit beta n=1 Tax=Sphingomonas bacterium TaxID=1895847 RepID=UPI00260346EE|nr:glycine--tRNA ligase subunit beta [Sphingomonas bacterium]MDB5679822.1 glycine--tRNA ligase subunit beta [Sphingomonas bacterium]
MTDFLLELRSEEIPARMQDKARDDLARLFTAELEKAGLRADAVVTFATPRRLALIARDLPAATTAVSEEVKGPRAGAPPQALEGFLRKTGLSADQLVERDGVLFAVIDKPGRKTADVLAEAIPAIIRAFPWPKSMRWGAASASTESLRWVRPLHGIVALLGEEVVPCEIAGVQSGAATLGHRFHHPGVITIGSASDYAEKLHACHVIVDQDERRAIIALGATMAVRKAGLELVQDEGLLNENAGLTEWPVPLLGRFDEDFLSVPHEVIQLTARVNQKYFVCRDAAGKLANAFICTANIDAADGGAKIVEGNRKVLAARLSDARFFYDTDLKVPLEEQAKKLEKIVFHEKLGTVADKVERVAKLARWLVEEGIVGSRAPAKAGALESEARHDPTLRPSPEHVALLAGQADRAARLAKADLVTGMVGEFPELQGLMGGYYAAAQGEDAAVAEAVRDHYKPVGQGDDVPTAPVTVAVSLADKLDTLSAFFIGEMPPTGSKDPFALRRAALGVLDLLQTNGLRTRLELPLSLSVARVAATMAGAEWAKRFDDLVKARHAGGDPMSLDEFERTRAEYIERARSPEELANFNKRANGAIRALLVFFADRLKVQQREAGVRHDLIDAVFALGGEDDLVRLLARVRALQSFVGTEDGANLLAGYKRAANILKKEAPGAPAKAGALASEAPDDAALRPSPEHGKISLSYTPEIAETDLIAALDAAEPAAADAVAHEDFEAAMAALATLRGPIDAFFDSVTVNDPDPDKRAARLALLARVRDAVHTVADFSKIEG